MATAQVNPTRMEMTRLKARLVTARRGHKLLKDKRDELMKQFLKLMRVNRDLRIRVEKALAQAHNSFTVASAIMSPEMLEQSLMQPKQAVSLEVGFQNIMSVNVPVYTFHTKTDDPGEIYPYGFAMTSGELDASLTALSHVLKDMLELAQIEKSLQLLASEIEKTRRRVNALEYVMIPEFEEKIRYIAMKLEENERGNITRLMKVKDMMIQAQIEAHQQQRIEAGEFL